MKKPGTAVAILCLVQFVDVLGITELIAATPRILRGVSAPASAASLLVTAYAMCFGGVLMVGARLGDRIGHRRALLGGIGGCAAGSLLAAVAPGLVVVVAGRCLQGASAAVSVPAALRLIVAAAGDADARRRALSVWSAAGAVAGAMGYVLGGALTEIAGWRAMFWANVPLAAVLVAGVRSQTGPDTGHDRSSLDLRGGALLVAAVMSLVFACSELSRPAGALSGLIIIAGAVALSALLVWTERRVTNPLVPREALRHGRLRIGSVAAFLNTATTSPVIAIATLELQRTAHLSPFAAGMQLMPFSAGVIGGAAVARAALTRVSRIGTVALGLCTIGAGDALLAGLARSGWLVAAFVAVAGVGIGISSVAATSLGTDVEEALQATATGMLNTAAQLGTALGVAALLLVATESAHSGAPIHGSRLGWSAAALLAFTGSAWLAFGSSARRARVDAPAIRWRLTRAQPPRDAV